MVDRDLQLIKEVNKLCREITERRNNKRKETPK